MRRSQKGLTGVIKDNYPGLPEELKEFNYYYPDAGHAIVAIPECLLKEAESDGDLDAYEVPFPCKYVLAKGYKIYKDHVVCDGEYNMTFGLVVDKKWREYYKPKATSDYASYVKDAALVKKYMDGKPKKIIDLATALSNNFIIGGETAYRLLDMIPNTDIRGNIRDLGVSASLDIYTDEELKEALETAKEQILASYFEMSEAEYKEHKELYGTNAIFGLQAETDAFLVKIKKEA